MEPQIDPPSPQDSQLKPSASSVEVKKGPNLKWWGLVFLGGILSVSGIAIATSQFQKDAPTEETSSINILPVKTVAVEPVKSYEIKQTYTGVLSALRTSELGFERQGKVVAIAASEGDKVTAGRTLATLDTKILETQRRSLLAGRGRARAQLEELLAGPRSQDIAAARARADAARAQLEELLAGPRSQDIAAARARANAARAQLEELQAGPRSQDIDAARARANAARAELEELQAGPRSEDIDAARANVRDVEEQLELARKRSKRREDLYEEGAISREQFDEAATSVSALEANLDATRSQLEELQAGTRTEQVEAGKARLAEAQSQLEELQAGTRPEQVEAGRARLAEAQSQLEELLAGTRPEQVEAGRARLAEAQSQLEELLAGTRPEQIAAQEALIEELNASIASVDLDISKSVLQAPFGGTVSVKYIDEGTVLGAGQSVFRLVEDGALEARIGLPVSVVSRLRPGSSQQLQIGEKSYSAIVSSVLPELDSSTRTQTVLLKLEPGASLEVASGQVARLEVTQTIPTEGYWLPTAALVRGERGLWSCYLLRGAESELGEDVYRVERSFLEVLHTESDRVLVRGTLERGDRAIASGTHRIVPGQLVRADIN
ncbi:MAG: HlyD family efflux transporter periplasmic adaptor subunit [Cyanobacteriota bacterium]|nr:HlyD family efflux transporter periplasmic adaptor subunit [Cyanobacteriota bacterium]